MSELHISLHSHTPETLISITLSVCVCVLATIVKVLHTNTTIQNDYYTY